MQIRSVPLNRVSSTKFLGLIIDNRLTFSEHTLSITKKLSQALGMLYKLLAVLPKGSLTCLYYSLFYPHLTYGITVWGFTAAKYLRKISLVQDKVVSLLGDRDVPREQVYRSLSLLSFYRIVNILHARITL